MPFVFLSNGEEVRFLDRETDAHAREIAGFFAQDDLERRVAARRVRRDLSGVATDRRIVDRDYQIECIEALFAEVSRGRRKLLVEMATGTGKTRTAAAFIKRLFEAGIVTRVLFLVDRIALARQAEDAFTDHLRDCPSHVLRPGRGFDRAKRVTIATLQTMIEVGRGELDWSAMDRQTREEFEELFSESDTITVDPRALERKFTIPERNRAMVRELRDAHEKGFMGQDGVRRWPAWGKTIVFAVTKRHAETLAEMFDKHFADLKPHPTVRYADFMVSDVGGGPAPDASAIVEALQG